MASLTPWSCVDTQASDHARARRRNLARRDRLRLGSAHSGIEAPAVEVWETLDGTERVRIEPGTQSGSVIRLRGKGVPNLGRRGRGDALLVVHVPTPERIGREERGLLEKLAETRGETVAKRGPSPGRLRRPGTP